MADISYSLSTVSINLLRKEILQDQHLTNLILSYDDQHLTNLMISYDDQHLTNLLISYDDRHLTNLMLSYDDQHLTNLNISGVFFSLVSMSLDSCIGECSYLLEAIFLMVIFNKFTELL